MSDSIEQVLRLIISKELKEVRSEDPLAEAVRELSEQVKSLANAIAGGQFPSVQPSRTGSVDTVALQNQHRPERVRALFLTSNTSMAVPDATFYLANSHVFRCVRAAFVAAFGPTVPNGEEFLDYFRGADCWLVILPDELRRGRGRPPRRMLPDTRFLVDLINSTSPEYIVATGRAVTRPLSEAVTATKIPKTRLLAVRTPRELWKPQFVARLKKALGSAPQSLTRP